MRFFFGKKRGRLVENMEIEDAVLTITQKTAAKIEWPLNRSILWFLFGCMAMILLVGLGGRIFYLNVVKGTEYRKIAERNSSRAELIPAPRGIIYDAYGKPLVQNVPSVDLILLPDEMPKDREKAEALKKTLRTLYLIEAGFLDDLLARVDRKNPSPYLLKERISQEEMLHYFSRSQELPGVRLLKTRHRQYSDSVIFSHILGYEGKIRKEELAAHPDYFLTDSIGKQGIEKSYETVLRGSPGFEKSEVDAFGQVHKELGTVSPTPGHDLILNIDADLQKKVFDSLRDTLEKQGLKRGAAVVLDPRNGAVRALVSLPSFDNNLFAKGIGTDDYAALIESPDKPLFNRVIAGEYPPGSTIKPVVAVAALTEGVIDEHVEIESRGGISVGSFSFRDWKVHGFTDIRRAIAVSSDVFFYSVGGGYGHIRGLGMTLMKKYENLFGYGEKTGVDMESEASGFIPDPAWKQKVKGERWYIGDDYHAAIGQGFITATPLQIANAIAAIANGGTLYSPRVVSQIRSPAGRVTSVSPKVVRKDFADPRILRIVREGMRETVVGGTAQMLGTLPVAVAGKSGTAEYGSEGKTHGWFVSFAPYENPELVMLILAEGQSSEGYVAVPVTREVYGWFFGRER